MPTAKSVKPLDPKPLKITWVRKARNIIESPSETIMLDIEKGRRPTLSEDSRPLKRQAVINEEAFNLKQRWLVISHVDHHELHKLELLWIGETRCSPGTHRDGEKALPFNSFSYGNQIKSQHSKKSPVKTPGHYLSIYVASWIFLGFV